MLLAENASSNFGGLISLLNNIGKGCQIERLMDVCYDILSSLFQYKTKQKQRKKVHMRLRMCTCVA